MQRFVQRILRWLNFFVQSHYVCNARLGDCRPDKRVQFGLRVLVRFHWILPKSIQLHWTQYWNTKFTGARFAIDSQVWHICDLLHQISSWATLTWIKLGLLDEEGYPVQTMGVLETPAPGAAPQMKGMRCGECGNYAVIKKDGCDFCSACGWVGVCGFCSIWNRLPD